MTTIIPDAKKIKSFRNLAGREPRPRDAAVAEDSQEGLGHTDDYPRTGAGCGAVLGMD